MAEIIKGLSLAEYTVARRPGWRLSGADRGDLRHGVHAERGPHGKSLCGVAPGTNSQGWAQARPGARLTCLACIKVAAKPAAKLQAQIERFWSKCIPEPNSGCWLWTHATFKTGYGKYTLHNRTHYAHRLAYELHYGVAPGKAYVCHRCDNPFCINPDHLFLGDARINVQDMIAKGRAGWDVRPFVAGPKRPALRGDSHPQSKIRERDVVIMRMLSSWLGVPAAQIARMYGISLSSAHRTAVKRASWRHVA